MKPSTVAFEPEREQVLRGCAGTIIASAVMWAAIAFFLAHAFH